MTSPRKYLRITKGISSWISVVWEDGCNFIIFMKTRKRRVFSLWTIFSFSCNKIIKKDKLIADSTEDIAKHEVISYQGKMLTDNISTFCLDPKSLHASVVMSSAYMNTRYWVSCVHICLCLLSELQFRKFRNWHNADRKKTLFEIYKYTVVVIRNLPNEVHYT